MNIVITGSSRGIGLNLAKSLLKRGHSVLINGRDRELLALTFAKLKMEFPDSLLHLYACDIALKNSVDRMLWESNRFFGSVDIWINNAGSNSKTKSIGIDNALNSISKEEKYNSVSIYNIYNFKSLNIKKITPGKTINNSLSLVKIRNSKTNLDNISEQIEKNIGDSTIIKDRGWLKLWKRK